MIPVLGSLSSNQSPLCFTSEPLPPIKSRDLIGSLLESEGLHVGAELCEHAGVFSSTILSQWNSCKRCYLVELFAPKANTSQANISQANISQVNISREFMTPAHLELQKCGNKLFWLGNDTSKAVQLLPEPIDFIYIDAHHDYCSVKQDIARYWPSIKPGGIMAGHDFENAVDVMEIAKLDWGLCDNGVRNMGTVQGAANDFFKKHLVQVTVTYRDANWNTWIVRKPRPLLHPQFRYRHGPLFPWEELENRFAGLENSLDALLSMRAVGSLVSLTSMTAPWKHMLKNYIYALEAFGHNHAYMVATFDEDSLAECTNMFLPCWNASYLLVVGS